MSLYFWKNILHLKEIIFVYKNPFLQKHIGLYDCKKKK